MVIFYEKKEIKYDYNKDLVAPENNSANIDEILAGKNIIRTAGVVKNENQLVQHVNTTNDSIGFVLSYNNSQSASAYTASLSVISHEDIPDTLGATKQKSIIDWWRK